MKRKVSVVGNKDTDCCCHGHFHGRKAIFIGIMLIIIGVMLETRYSFPQVLMLIGGILLVKGILLASIRKD